MNPAVDNAAGQGAGAGAEGIGVVVVDEVMAAVEEAEEKRKKTLHVNEHSRKNTNLATERGATTRRWGRRALVHRSKIVIILTTDIQNGGHT